MTFSTRMRGVAAAVVLVALGTISLTADATVGRPAVAVVADETHEKRSERATVDPAAGTTEEFVAAQAAGQFHAIAPYRVWDTRVNLGHKVFRNDFWFIDVITDYQGTPQIPSNATAVTFNLTVTETETTFGFLSVVPGNVTTIPQTSSVNWALADFTIANGGAVALGFNSEFGLTGSIGIYMDGAPGAAAHVILDVTGYYAP